MWFLLSKKGGSQEKKEMLCVKKNFNSKYGAKPFLKSHFNSKPSSFTKNTGNARFTGQEIIRG